MLWLKHFVMKKVTRYRSLWSSGHLCSRFAITNNIYNPLILENIIFWLDRLFWMSDCGAHPKYLDASI
jgi:hypothetical protein